MSGDDSVWDALAATPPEQRRLMRPVAEGVRMYQDAADASRFWLIDRSGRVSVDLESEALADALARLSSETTT